LATEDVPDATALSKFRRLLLPRDLTRTLLDEIDIALRGHGLLMKEGRWGDARSGPVRSLVDTLADASEVLPAHVLLNGHEQKALGNAGRLRIICGPACVKTIEATTGVAQRVACGRHVLFRDPAADRQILLRFCFPTCIWHAKYKGADASSESRVRRVPYPMHSMEAGIVLHDAGLRPSSRLVPQQAAVAADQHDTLVTREIAAQHPVVDASEGTVVLRIGVGEREAAIRRRTLDAAEVDADQPAQVRIAAAGDGAVRRRFGERTHVYPD